MALLDKVPGDLNLYIGGLFTLRRRDALQQANITHVLSVLRLPLDQELFAPFQHMVVEVDDVDDEDLLQHFPATNRFIQDGLDSGGGVLVHCAMGKSRSATCVIAYLMHKHRVSPAEALAQIRQARSLCEPNEGFMEQLEIYHRMEMADDVEQSPEYQRWVYQREVEMSRACNQAPEAEKIRFEDEHSDGQSPAELELRCRKCRRPLATSAYLNAHSPTKDQGPGPAGAACSHYFIDPLSWMRPELEQGKLDGRLECPKCSANVGKYAWQGMACSCGDWVVPAISLAKGRIDEVRKRAGAVEGAAGIRRPPGAPEFRTSNDEWPEQQQQQQQQ
ncbi:dual specificity protein phosphatase 12 [Saccharata proteae CBS 121410]|uniref:protein-tyrosine-phosphatase n=1 Tax=Saccharata proteae CBS 121410 TaxID=1314787 RepID=A0A9P4HT17_9PEZI|nr:dual specificity protein phosphatase 12 [Saccharata proteae CBS 121410]